MFDLEKLESIEIVPEQKIFKINGEDFGKGCTDFELCISKSGIKDYKVSINLSMKGSLCFDGKTGEIK